MSTPSSSSKAKNNLSFILYENNKVPRYLQLSPREYKAILYVPVVLTVFSIFALAGSYFYTKNIEKLIKAKEPLIIKNLRDENSTLAQKNTELTTLNLDLTNRLANETISAVSASSLNIIAPVKGQKDLTSPASINIEDLKVTKKDDKAELNFNIINITKDNNKVSGYIHIFLFDGNNYFHYPEGGDSIRNFSLNYTKGESFATSRFRPVTAKFDMPKNKTVMFKILIFNRLGDIVHQQLFREEIK
ncbi:hypothetical protein ACRXCV_07565 [Halobacteriovorax sp. GFR7]|uniref:hypothetical protein n=1 Tax=unclassified Halobacteriovorax TaxID=2639665 RepID=UPI00371638BE